MYYLEGLMEKPEKISDTVNFYQVDFALLEKDPLGPNGYQVISNITELADDEVWKVDLSRSKINKVDDFYSYTCTIERPFLDDLAVGETITM